MQDRGLQFTFWVGPQGVTRSEGSPVSGQTLTWTIHNDGASEGIERQVDRWMAGYVEGQELPLPLIDMQEQTLFTCRVLLLLQMIPFGQFLTYGDVAKQMGNPLSSRAVGSACGRNHALLLVPCHRVLALGRRLGGFSSGLEVKRRLLLHEGIVATGTNS